MFLYAERNSLFKVGQQACQTENFCDSSGLKSDHYSNILKQAELLSTPLGELTWSLCGYELEIAQNQLWLNSLWRTLSREEIHISLTILRSSRCIGICFLAISRCYSQTLMWLTSCGHKTLAKIVSSKALFLDARYHKAIYGWSYKMHATFNPST